MTKEKLEKGFLNESQLEFITKLGYKSITDLKEAGPLMVSLNDAGLLHFNLSEPTLEGLYERPYFTYEVYGASVGTGNIKRNISQAKKLKRHVQEYFPNERIFCRSYGDINKWIPKNVKEEGKWIEIYDTDDGWMPIIHRSDLSDFEDVITNITKLMLDTTNKKLKEGEIFLEEGKLHIKSMGETK